MPLSPSSMSPSSMASSIPQFYSNYTFTTSDDVLDLDFPIATVAAAAHASLINCNNKNINNNNYAAIMDNFAMWGSSNNNGQDCFFTNNSNSPVMIDNGALDHVLSSLDYDTIISSANWVPSSFGEQLGGGGGVSPDFSVPAIYPDCRMGLYGGNDITGFHQSLISNRYQPRIGEFGEECCGFVMEDIKPQTHPNASRENWGIQGNQMAAAVEEPNIKVGRYSEEERKERILRYLKKRNQRNFNKTIKYACRKTLADRRVRVRGRFARNNELCEEQDMAAKKHEINHHLIKEDFDSIQFQLKNDDEEWLQEAMASLVYLSQSSPEDM